jgi:hypothetical protein
MAEMPLDRLRAICLALPETTEVEAWSHPTFRVRDKIFAVLGGMDGLGLTMKAPPGVQAILVGADPERFYVPSHVGHKGWIGIHLAVEPDWEEIASLIRRSYRMTAPKRLAALVE